MDRDEAGAEAFDAGEVLVAVGLIDLPLAAPFGIQRLHRDAVRLHRAIAAAFADQIVDEHPLVRIRKGAALAPTPLFGGAGLVVDQHGDAGRLAQIALHLVQIVTVPDRNAGGPVGADRVLVRLVADHDHLRDALGGDLPANLVRRDAALYGLAAGHGDGVVVKDLVGYVDAGRGGGADRHQAGMEVGAVAQVLEHMLG